MSTTHEKHHEGPKLALTIDQLRDQIHKVETDYNAKGIGLSGRIIHVSHYLPIVAALNGSSSSSSTTEFPTPPRTPDRLSPTPVLEGASASAITTASTEASEAAAASGKERWSVSPRRGHTAMHSGIRSLSSTHEQIMVGWTGPIVQAPATTITVSSPAPSAASPDPAAAAAASPNASTQTPNQVPASSTSTTIPTASISEADRTLLDVSLQSYRDLESEHHAHHSSTSSSSTTTSSSTESQSHAHHSHSHHHHQALKQLSYAPVWLPDSTAHAHYEGYCKSTLWPLFHYLLWQDVTTELPAKEEDTDWRAYVEANEAYAKKVVQVAKPGDLIWVHDYHLLLVPRMVRTLMPEAYVGLFVHTPFPSSEIFRCLPKRKEILDGMLGASLVVFQTYSYARHFSSSCVRVCGYESAPNGIDVKGVLTTVMHCPVGIDAARVEREIGLDAPVAAVSTPGGGAGSFGEVSSVGEHQHQHQHQHHQKAEALLTGIQSKMDALRALYQGKKIIVARDKLDVVKGITQKLKAFEKLLADYPQWRGNVVMIQVTSPALSDSPKLERQVSELVARVNGEFGSLDFVPVHHYHQVIKKDEFYALLSVADLALITPLRDGMNTTSMEYVICQQKTHKSPLILSEFMGISPSMTHALQVNPWDLGDVASQIDYALGMSEQEKALRQSKLFDVVRTHTSHTWAAMLVSMLLGVAGAAGKARRTPELDLGVMGERYKSAKKRLLMFDYDGTLTPIVKTPSMAVPSPAALEALEKLSADPRNVVYIISGREGSFLDQHLGHLARVGFSAEHGCFMKSPLSIEEARTYKKGDPRPWKNLTEALDMSWMSEVKEIFEYYTERTTGSFVELKKSSITWHYRASDPEWGLFQCRQCLDLLETNVAPKRPIEVLVGKMNLEVRPVAINKGEIVKRLLYNNPDAEFIFCAGDDKTDEDMFRALGGVAASASASASASPSGTATPVLFEAPLSANLTLTPLTSATQRDDNGTLTPVELAIHSSAIFSVSVGASSKKTLASWHVQTPQEVVGSMLGLVNAPGAAEEVENVVREATSSGVTHK